MLTFKIVTAMRGQCSTATVPNSGGRFTTTASTAEEWLCKIRLRLPRLRNRTLPSEFLRLERQVAEERYNCFDSLSFRLPELNQLIKVMASLFRKRRRAAPAPEPLAERRRSNNFVSHPCKQFNLGTARIAPASIEIFLIQKRAVRCH